MKDMRRIDENECAKQNIVWQSQNDPFKVFPMRILNIIKLYYDNIYIYIYIYTYYISLYFIYPVLVDPLAVTGEHAIC